MIDFRYHLVSLISVFLALAVGIALGAGPLKETIGDTLTGQVDQLRAEKEDLRAELSDAQAGTAALEAFATAAAPQLVAGSLTDRRVAVVSVGETSPETLAALDASVAAAGGTTSAHVTLADAYTDDEQRSFRQALVGNLVEYLDPAPAADAGLDTELAASLVQALTTADAAAPDALSSNATLLLELLSSGDSPLVSVAEEVTAPADAVLVVSAPSTDEATDSASPAATAADDVVAAAVALLEAGDTYAEAAVLADGPRTDGGVTSAILADGTLSTELTTVTDAQTVRGQTVVPLALAAAIAGTTGHYGSADDETAVPPAVTLTPPERTAEVPAAADGSQG